MKISVINKSISWLLAVLFLLNLLVWGLAVGYFSHSTASLALCLMAYGFGLRHALDADHITAIDNVTRKLIQNDRPPISVGTFFSLGHASVVILLTLAIALVTHSVKQHLPQLANWGTIIGGIISSLFLLLFGVINFVIFYRIIKHNDDSHHAKGFLSTLLKPLFNIVTKSWHMFPVGFLFGLGFDTATEVALLGLAGYQAAQQVSIWAILIFPLLFTAGMCFVDSVSGLLMLGACRWAYINPQRKRYYNLVITGFSFLTALLIGIYEAIQLIADHLHIQNSTINFINNHFEWIGVGLILTFLLVWFGARQFAAMNVSDRSQPMQ